MSEKDDIMIPVEGLQYGFENCRVMIEVLLDSSEILLNSNYFPTSIALSILALEESAKLELIHKKIMTSTPIKEKEWKNLTSFAEAHIKKLVKPVKDENSEMKSYGKETYDEMKKISAKLGFGTMPSFEDISSIDDSHFAYYRLLNKIKQDCLYVDWNGSDWFSFLNLPIEKQQAFANVRLIYTKQLIFGLILRNRWYQLNFKSHSKKIESEIQSYRDKLSEVENTMKSKKFKKYEDIRVDLLKQYSTMRLHQFVIEDDEDDVIFTLNDIHELPDFFFEFYISTGILPETILTLKKKDFDLENHAVATGFDGCGVCKKPREPDLSIWQSHFRTNEHYGNVFDYFKSRFKLKNNDPALLRLKNIIFARRSKNSNV